MLKQAEARKDGVINPKNYNFEHGKFWCSQNAENQPETTVERGYMCPRGLVIWRIIWIIHILLSLRSNTLRKAALLLSTTIGKDGQLPTTLYNKRCDFKFQITNSPFLTSNIPSSPTYGVFISQLMRYARACSSSECFILRAELLSYYVREHFHLYGFGLDWISCLTSQLTIFQSYMWRHIDVQAGWRRSCTYGRAPTP